MLPKRIGIVGLGLIGASVARALRQAQPQLRLVGVEPDAASRRHALAEGMVDALADDCERLAATVDLVLVATPVRAIAAIVDALLAASETVQVTDSGSVKGSVLRALTADAAARRRFVPGHPVAGSERFGVTAADPALFRERRVILTPAADTDPSAVAAVRGLWEATGARVETMSAAHHDEVLAATSHLPHVLAYALVDCLAGLEDRREIFAYAAGGFRDFTRIASSSPEMWRDILLENRSAVDSVLDSFQLTLDRLRDALGRGDESQLLATLMRARAARQRFLQLMEGGS